MFSPSQTLGFSKSIRESDDLYLKLFLFLAILAWTSGIFVNHLTAVFDEFILLLPFSKKTYSLVCHQDPAKIFSPGGIETMVCSRCAGIYIGFFLFSFSMFLNLKRFRIPLKLFVIAAALTLLDIFLVIFDIMPYSKLTAFITGFLLGSLGFLYFNRAIQNLLLEIRADREN